MSTYGGKAANFLMKKTWHTSTLVNQEKVWLAEQAKEKEEKKLRELQRQLAEERELEDLKAMQVQAGLAPKAAERLEWMYQPGMGAGAAQPSTEEYLTGKEYKAEEEKNDVQKIQDEGAVGAKFIDDISNNDNEKWLRARSDPLLEIKKREMEAMANIRKNPVKMAMIRQQVEKIRGERDQKKQEKKRKRHGSGKDEEKRSHSYRHGDEDEGRHHHRSAQRVDRPGYGLQLPKDYVPRDEREKRDNEEYLERKREREREKLDSSKHKGVWDERKLRYVRPRREHGRSSKMSEEERERRLAAMMSDAQHNENLRTRRTHHAERTDDTETAGSSASGQARAAKPEFLDKLHSDVYDAGGDMKDRIQRNAHYLQRHSVRSDDDRSAWRKG